MPYQQIDQCRVCGNHNLSAVLDLGEQSLTGVFPHTVDELITRGPLRLVRCAGSRTHSCGLVQLEHTYELGEMFGDNYGYRSGLNASMVNHLHAKVDSIVRRSSLRSGDLIVDIGSNDGTTLSRYPAAGYELVGIDPTADKFRDYYPPHVELIADFFSAESFRRRFAARKAKVITSFSMFYDLQRPLTFMHEVCEVLADDGTWVCEQSYLPTMLSRNAYDTVCHEHLEYYALTQMKWMADRVGLVIVDATFNDVNGGSFSIDFRKSSSGARQASVVDRVIHEEASLGLDSDRPLLEFAQRVSATRDELRIYIDRIKSRNQTLYGLGASTKGNVLLQYCGITTDDIPMIGDVNPDKCGRLTPGTVIPIVSEHDVLALAPDHLLVLPWHFRNYFIASSRFKGRSLVFPLPHVEDFRIP